MLKRERDTRTNRLGYACDVCEKWWTRQPRSQCPGVRVYVSWERAAAAGLHTRTQWRGLRRRVVSSAKAVAVFETMDGWYSLFSEQQTVPMREASPAQRAVLEANRQKARTCRRCGRVQESRVDLDRRHICWSCAGDEEAARHEAMLESARCEVVDWARKLIEAVDFVILDTETTGLDWDAQVVEIAVVGPDGATLLNSRVRPTCAISAGARAVHRLSDEMVAGAPLFPEVYSSLMNAIAGRRVLVYNADFDARVLSYMCELHGLPSLETDRWLDLMRPYSAWCGDWSEYHRDFRWQRLPGGGHLALVDCLAARDVLLRMAGGGGAS